MKRRTKRKIKKFFQKNSLVLFVVPLFVSIFCFGIAYSQMRQQLDIQGNAQISSNGSVPGGTCAIGLTFEETTSWSENELNFKVTFTNNSDRDIQSITIQMLKTGTYQFNWGTGISQTQDDTYYYFALEPWVYGAQLGANPDGSYRNSLLPGESITIDFSFAISEPMTIDDIRRIGSITNCGQYSDEGFEEKRNGNAVIKLSPAEVLVDTIIEFDHAADYQPQLIYKITLTNNNEFDISDWRVVFYHGPDYTYDSTWPISFNLIREYPEEYYLALDSLYTLIKAGESVEFYVAVMDDNPTYDENGIYIIPDDYMPDVIAAGIKKGTESRSVDGSIEEEELG